MKKKTPASNHDLIADTDQQDPPMATSAPHEEARDWVNMSVDELWSLHEQIITVITAKIHSERQKLEARLLQLSTPLPLPKVDKPPKSTPRHYPQVNPKYRDPANPKDTWSGRGKLPRWLTTQIRSGKHLEDFRIK